MSADAHSQKLFCDLVASALRARMGDQFLASSEFDDLHGFSLPEDRLDKLENQVGSLVEDVSFMKGALELMLGAFGLRRGPSHQQQTAQPQPQQFLQPQQEQFSQPQQVQFLQPQQQQLLQPSAVLVPAAPASIRPLSNFGSSGSSPATPSRTYAFRCPICMKPQYTPKSHCNHMRKLVSVGQGNCWFRSDVAFHAAILRCHGNASQFVSWYTKRLRSSVAQEFTEADIRDYEQTQAQLQHDVQHGVVHNGN